MTGRGYLVLGATGGIGSAVCSLLVARGAGVLASGVIPGSSRNSAPPTA
jgi:NAD(P)-dependent dehydrogenase (short-subunit alcohol dehydrogenase family)